MKRKNLFNLLMVLGLALALASGVAMARRAQAQEGGPQGMLGPQAAVGTAFTYQGRLIDDGTPVEGTCGFGLSLYGSPTGDDQISTTQDKSSVSVSNGYFTITDLDFGAGAFDGNARYLEIAVDCGDGPATLEPRVALNAAPYAHSLRPGAVISGTESTGLQVQTSAGGTAQALLAHASSSTGQTSGVWGATKSEEGGVGVVGRAEASSGKAYGIFGISFSPGGTGVYGTAPSTGTVGIATASSGTNYGVYGRNASNSGAGVYGTSSHATGTGVRGYSADGPGVEGSSDSGNGVVGSSTTGNGVWGYSTNGHAIWSEGDTHINGNLTWVTRTSYIAVSTAAFIPELLNDSGHVEYDNEGYYLQNESSSSEWFIAPVQLPHGATVTELRVGWRDGSNTQATVYLRRRSMIDITLATEAMASVASVGTLGGTQEGVWSDDTIDNAAVNNENYTYYLEVGMHDSTEDIVLKGVVIEYTITEPY